MTQTKIFEAMPKTPITIEDGMVVIDQYADYSSKTVKIPVGMWDTVSYTINRMLISDLEGDSHAQQ